MSKSKTQGKNLTTKRHFDLFKKTAEEAIDLLGLKEYEVEFAHELCKNACADIDMHADNLAVIRLSTDFYDGEVTDERVCLAAKHEVLHLLLNRLNTIARVRFCSPDELDRAEHDIVYRLEKII
jgi:hypothetical protein